MNRRRFIKNVSLVTTWLGISVVIQACSDDESATAPAPTPEPGDISGVIGNNHSHAVVITGAQLTAADSVTLTMGGGTHTHTVSLTTPQVAAIAAGTTTQVNSSNDDGHIHLTTFN